MFCLSSVIFEHSVHEHDQGCSIQTLSTVFFLIIHLIPIHEYSPCVSLAVVREGQRVPEAHHGAAQGEGLRLRDL